MTIFLVMASRIAGNVAFPVPKRILLHELFPYFSSRYFLVLSS